MGELGKFDFKINVISNGLEKHMNFNINNKLVFVDNFQFLNSSFDSLARNLNKDSFQYLSKEFNNEVLHGVSQIRC